MSLRSVIKSFAAPAVAAALAATPVVLDAASHREAPITALDRAADITDFFAFASYDPASSGKVTFIMNVDPLLDPGNGPNYFPFDPDILYEIKIDNSNRANNDVTFQLRFQTEVRAPAVFQAYVGAGTGITAPSSSPPPVAPGTQIVPPAITELDGAGSAGLNLRQTYSVTMIKENAPTGHEKHGKKTTTVLSRGKTLFALPTNVGPRTMPNYPALFQSAINDLGNGVRVFAGTVSDPFYIDLGAAFDTLNFRASAFAADPGHSVIPGVLSTAQDASDTTNYAANNVSGYNVNTIAIEVPIAMLTRTGTVLPATSPEATIGAWGTTSRPRLLVRRLAKAKGGLPAENETNLDDDSASPSHDFRQVQRMANPLINELIIGTGSKDRWSVSAPANDAQFASFALDPLLGRVLNAAYGDALKVPPAPRKDLLVLMQYMAPIAAANTPPGPVADLLRLNTGVPPTPLAAQHRLGLLAHDAAGNSTPDLAAWPNGRRPNDDVTDIALRAVAGVLAGAPYNGYPNNRLGDGVNAGDVMPYPGTFPYVSAAHDGRNSRHIDPGEPGGGPVN